MTLAQASSAACTSAGSVTLAGRVSLDTVWLTASPSSYHLIESAPVCRAPGSALCSGASAPYSLPGDYDSMAESVWDLWVNVPVTSASRPGGVSACGLRAGQRDRDLRALVHRHRPRVADPHREQTGARDRHGRRQAARSAVVPGRIGLQHGSGHADTSDQVALTAARHLEPWGQHPHDRRCSQRSTHDDPHACPSAPISYTHLTLP